MATIAYTPSQIASLFAAFADIRGVYAVNGARTGFGFYDNGSDPAYFVSDNALLNLFSDEGFFTGSNPKVFYTPEQAATLMTKMFSIDAQDMYGIEYKLRTEGFTVGDFMLGMVQHSPGDSAAVIMGNLGAEGYVTGLQGILSPADPALFDSQCVDGRCMGSGCFAPNFFTVDATSLGGAGWTALYVDDSFTVNYPYVSKLLLFLSFTEVFDLVDCQVLVDGVAVAQPKAYGGPGSNGWTFLNLIGTVDLTAGVDHVITIHAKCKEVHTTTFTLCALVFKADC